MSKKSTPSTILSCPLRWNHLIGARVTKIEEKDGVLTAIEIQDNNGNIWRFSDDAPPTNPKCSRGIAGCECVKTLAICYGVGRDQRERRRGHKEGAVIAGAIRWEENKTDALIHLRAPGRHSLVLCGLAIPPVATVMGEEPTCPRCIALADGDVACLICNHLASEHAGTNGQMHYGRQSTGACGCVLSKDEVKHHRREARRGKHAHIHRKTHHDPLRPGRRRRHPHTRPQN
jgi:hypothetical protein